MIDRDQLGTLIKNFSTDQQAVLSEIAKRLAIIKIEHFTGQIIFEVVYSKSDIVDASVTTKSKIRIIAKR